jgi:DNA (cytosine-5)-methyltransferase 1
MPGDMDAISLFTGTGGLDLGAEQAGFRTVAGVESDASARHTILANVEFLPALNETCLMDNVCGLAPEALLERARLEKGDAALFVGGPPCTPFSKSGYWLEYKRAGNDPGKPVGRVRTPARRHPPESVPHGERVWARLQEPEP